MEVQVLMRLKANLEKFLKRFDDCIKRPESRRHLRTYVSGQVSGLERKSVEPMALRAGVAPRTLEEFLSIHRWDEDQVLKRAREIVAAEHACSGAIGVIDGTSFPKKGDKTVGVQRQYCGETGKIDNCVVTVNLGYVAEDFHCLLGSDLYVPEGWTEALDRRRQAKVPEGVRYRPKWQIALDLLWQSVQDGVKLAWVTADEEYGRCRDFRHGVSGLGLQYVVEVPCAIRGWTKRLVPAFMNGRSGKRRRLVSGTGQARRIDSLWHRGGPSWALFRIKETQKGPLVWEARVTRFFPCDKQRPGQECWLIVARHPLSGEVKYFLSDAPAETDPQTLLRVAFTRWHVERMFQDGKGEIGLGHFEVRTYPSVKRHMALSLLSFLFLSRETEKLRKKTRHHAVSSEKSGRGATGHGVFPHTEEEKLSAFGQGVPVPARASREGTPQPPKAKASRAA